MTNYFPLTSALKENLSQITAIESRSNPEKTMLQLSNWHNLIGIEKAAQGDKRFLQFLASPVLMDLIARNTGHNVTDVQNILPMENNFQMHAPKKRFKTLKNTGDIMNAYVTVTKPEGANDLRMALEWERNYAQTQNQDDAEIVEIIQSADAAVLACIALGSEHSFHEASRLLNWQAKHGAAYNANINPYIIKNSLLVVDGCMQLGTPKAYSIAVKLLENKEQLMPHNSNERMLIIERQKELADDPIANAAESMEHFINNFINHNNIELADPVQKISTTTSPHKALNM